VLFKQLCLPQRSPPSTHTYEGVSYAFVAGRSLKQASKMQSFNHPDLPLRFPPRRTKKLILRIFGYCSRVPVQGPREAEQEAKIERDADLRLILDCCMLPIQAAEETATLFTATAIQEDEKDTPMSPLISGRLAAGSLLLDEALNRLQSLCRSENPEIQLRPEKQRKMPG